MYQKWFVKFHAGDFSMADAPGLGRPVEVDSDQIETLPENNQRFITREKADILKIPKSIKLLVKHFFLSVFHFMEKTKQTFWPNQDLHCENFKCQTGHKRIITDPIQAIPSPRFMPSLVLTLS